jgi:hypothetical protein
MRLIGLTLLSLTAAATLGGCASSSDSWADACRRDYERNRAAAAAAGAVIGAGAGAAIAKDDAAGAAIGAAVGAAVGGSMAKRDDPCGYGFAGYPYNRRYGYWDDRAGYWRRY